MRRNVFWILAALFLVASLFGAYLVDAPWRTNPDIPRSTTREWYSTATFVCAVVGGMIGGLVGGGARSIPHLMGESGLTYLNRVAGRGIWGAQVGGFIALLVLLIGFAALYANNELEMIGTADRVLLLIAHGKVLQPLCCGAFFSSLACMAVTAFPPVWGGQYALIPFPKPVEV